MFSSLCACLIGFVLDLAVGDPYWMFFHPIRLIGKMIAGGERMFRKLFGDTQSGQLAAGVCMVVSISSISFLVPFLILYICTQINPVLALVAESILCYFLFAVKSLKDESMKVYKALKTGDIKESRKAVSMIVGRDTNALEEEGVAKAAIETVAENTSDGIIAPMLFMIIGGAPLGYFYKAVNTMDSMIGYKNQTYLYFGRCAARTDDVVNYIPARISAIFMLAASFLFPKFNGKNAWKIYKRDRKKSESPNAAQTETVCAGALNIRLLGDAYYFGELHKKEYIGEPIEEVTPEKIVEVNKLLYATAGIGIIVLGVIKFGVIYMKSFM